MTALKMAGATLGASISLYLIGLCLGEIGLLLSILGLAGMTLSSVACVLILALRRLWR